MPLPENFPAYLRNKGFYYITDGLWSKVTGAGLYCVVYVGNGKWIVQNRTDLIVGITAQQVYEYIEGTHPNVADVKNV